MDRNEKSVDSRLDKIERQLGHIKIICWATLILIVVLLAKLDPRGFLDLFGGAFWAGLAIVALAGVAALFAKFVEWRLKAKMGVYTKREQALFAEANRLETENQGNPSANKNDPE